MILTYPETNSNEELETGLLGACQSGALQEVEDCLEALIHPNTDQMWDPLHHAAGTGYPGLSTSCWSESGRIMELLLQKGSGVSPSFTVVRRLVGRSSR